ncbi:MAG: PilZ domain-containing protein [Desulfobacterales bacterium]
MTIERRKYVRFLAKNNTFAALREGFKKVGKIGDISIKGLGFSYLSEFTQVDSADHHTQVDIFISGNGFHLSNVPCRIVHETPDTKLKKSFIVQMSSCGLQFGELTRSQLEQLDLFIENFTTGILDA